MLNKRKRKIAKKSKTKKKKKKIKAKKLKNISGGTEVTAGGSGWENEQRGGALNKKESEKK